jgi:hypothetical protein
MSPCATVTHFHDRRLSLPAAHRWWPPSVILLIASFVHILQAVSRAVVVLEIYGESQCPDTTRFFVQQLWPIWQNMSTQFQLSFIPFGKANCTSNGTDDFT